MGKVKTITLYKGTESVTVNFSDRETWFNGGWSDSAPKKRTTKKKAAESAESCNADSDKTDSSTAEE